MPIKETSLEEDFTNKTLSLRILRVLQTDEIEKEIFDQRVIIGFNKLEGEFWKEIEKKYRDTIIPQAYFYSILRCIQKEVVHTYNSGITKLYQALIIDKVKDEENEGKELSVLKASGKYVYHENEHKLPSYIRLGILKKVVSNFNKDALERMEKSLTTARINDFPIPIQYPSSNGNGFKISAMNEDFCINLPLVKIEDVSSKYKSYNIKEPYEINNIKVLLSTLRRRKNTNQWLRDDSTSAEIRKVMTGEYIVTTAEIINRKRFDKGKDDWFVNFVIKAPKKDTLLDKKIIAGIDIGVSSPLVCAVSNSLKRLTIKSSELRHFYNKNFGYRRELSRQWGFHRLGHGKKNHFKPIDNLSKGTDRFRDAIINRWVKEVINFCLKEKVGIVQMENLSGITKQETFFSEILRRNWPYYKMQMKLENKFKEYGIEVHYISPKNTSKKCHSCEYINEYFTFEYRKKNKMPLFKCEECDIECSADYNAAKNMTVL